MNENRRRAFEKTRTGAENFPFGAVLQRGDLICFGQACSEPRGLLAELLRQGEMLSVRLGRLGLFVAGSYSGLIRPELGAWFTFSGYGAIGDSASLVKDGLLDVYPVHYSWVVDLLTRQLRANVALLQLSPPDAQGRHSLGVASDYQLAVARQARVVIAEVNQRVPFSPSALLPDDIRIDHVVLTDLPLVELPASKSDDAAERIAACVADLIPDGATIQMGVGSVMEAIGKSLRGHRDLGIHSGVLTDGMSDLIELGVVTNARKTNHAGLSVVGSLLGTRRLFDFAHNNSGILLAETHQTHGAASLSGVSALCAINSAVEVDLTGQINAEVSRGHYIGAVGGQVDFLRAASQSSGGLSIIALQSTAGRGAISRIVGNLSGPVTTPRSDVDFVVTEWGVAKLRGKSLSQRMKAMIGVAHPDHRDDLSRLTGVQHEF